MSRQGLRPLAPVGLRLPGAFVLPRAQVALASAAEVNADVHLPRAVALMRA